MKRTLVSGLMDAEPVALACASGARPETTLTDKSHIILAREGAITSPVADRHGRPTESVYVPEHGYGPMLCTQKCSGLVASASSVLLEAAEVR